MTISVTQVKNSRNGLTFIEVFLVILIIAALAAISFPNLKNTFKTIQLNSFARSLQGYMNYLRERSIIEQKVIYFNIDNEANQYWAKIKDSDDRLKTHSIPDDYEIEMSKKTNPDDERIMFLPDGSIDKLTLNVKNRYGDKIALTTEGVFGKVKYQSQQ